MLGLVVVIPSYNETGLFQSLHSLGECDRPNCAVETIVVVNYPEDSTREVIDCAIKSIEDVERAQNRYNTLNFSIHHLFTPDLPRKHAGVGLARQIGMDEAAYRLYSVSNPNGIIASFDADSTCERNYLVEMEKLWRENPKTSACAIRYEHPTSGVVHQPAIYEGITLYELHLRYYNQASRHIEFPFAYHTVGSSMACTAKTYVSTGGMNRHQAGEDFYFLQKIIPHGHFRELNSTCVYPSPRPSYRVPFGTGRAMQKYLDDPKREMLTYNLDSFIDLKGLFNKINYFWDAHDCIIDVIGSLPDPVREYLNSVEAAKRIEEVFRNTSNLHAFRKRFFLWFDAFQLLKYLNHVNGKHYERQPVMDEAVRLGKLIGLDMPTGIDPAGMLERYRIIDGKPTKH